MEQNFKDLVDAVKLCLESLKNYDSIKLDVISSTRTITISAKDSLSSGLVFSVLDILRVWPCVDFCFDSFISDNENFIRLCIFSYE